MHVCTLKAELHLPGARSLKEKRRPLKSLQEKLRNRFGCSVAEVNYQELHQRAEIGVAIVAAEMGILRKQVQAIREFINVHPEFHVCDISEETIKPF